MDRMLVVIFDDEKQAYEGSRALKQLHNEGSVAVYAAAVVARDSEGKVSVKDAADKGPLGMAVGMMVGAMIGVVGGPAGVAVGAASGTLAGSIADLYDAGVDLDFLDQVGGELKPGKAALIADADEYWSVPADTRMEALGGTVLRRWRTEVADEQLEKELAATRADWAALKAEYNEATGDMKAKAKSKMDEAKATWEKTAARAKARINTLEEESKAKAQALKEQINTATGEAKAKIEKRSQEIREDYNRRIAKLKESWEHTKEKLAA